MQRRLSKSDDKRFFGVAGGLAEYFNLHPTLVRAIFIFFTIFVAGSGLVVYLVLAMLMSSSAVNDTAWVSTWQRDQESQSEESAHRADTISSQSGTSEKTLKLGCLLIVLLIGLVLGCNIITRLTLQAA